MKNPLYEEQAKPRDSKSKHAAARDALESYLRASKPYADISEAKLRRVHPDLAKDEVWDAVSGELKLEQSTRASSSRGESAPTDPAELDRQIAELQARRSELQGRV